MKVSIKYIVVLLSAATLVTSGAFGYWYATQPKNLLPENISSRLTFSPLVIADNSKDYSSSSYKFSTAEDNVQIFSFLVRTENNTVSLTEYVQPSQFAEVPDYKDHFLSNVVNQYATVQSANGTIYLGKAVKQNDRQLGVMLEKGLIIFLSPEKKLSETQWRQLGDQLELQKKR